MPRNNPRAIAETVSLSAWRTRYDHSKASLFIDVNFGVGYVGSESDGPIRFSLQLRRATVKVVESATSEFEVLPSTLMRNKIDVSKSFEERSIAAHVEGGAEIDGSLTGISAEGGVEMAGRMEITKKITTEKDQYPITFNHFQNGPSFGFNLVASDGGALLGRAWEVDSEQMQVRDTQPERKKGERPEVTVRVECMRRDLIIRDIEHKVISGWWQTLTRGKQEVINAEIRNQITRNGLEAGDLSDPFAKILIADVITRSP